MSVSAILKAFPVAYEDVKIGSVQPTDNNLWFKEI